ncbi:hypothetical protein [Actinoplanes sp. N902-109]|uniref:hypothetical protein n=1 Tax=Actinoplanes sp. (strain N902-109) TaxID=649831 RepID=UPI0003295DAD|nr:hypothetical protein [Actinoplanes sp. N902-109]AGL19501.1 hypothetical protein L083_5991 [Actinoplanes sp. N902-109]
MTYPGADPAIDPERAAVEQRRKDREEEFGTYVAVQEIPWGNVPAFYPGEQVPKSTVEKYDWAGLGLVAKRDTKAGRAVLEQTGNATPDELAAWAEQDKAAAAKSTATTTRSGGSN